MYVEITINSYIHGFYQQLLLTMTYFTYCLYCSERAKFHPIVYKHVSLNEGYYYFFLYGLVSLKGRAYYTFSMWHCIFESYILYVALYLLGKAIFIEWDNNFGILSLVFLSSMIYFKIEI